MSGSRLREHARVIQMPSAERRSKILRELHQRGKMHDLARTIVGAIPDKHLPEFAGLDFHAHMLQTRTQAIFRVQSRAEVIPLMVALPPSHLVKVKVKYGYREDYQYWPATHENIRVQVIERVAIAPFMYRVEQGAHYGPIHTVTWITSVLGGSADRFIVTADIALDPAGFVRQVTDKVGHRSTVAWVKNGGFPAGNEFGHWGRVKAYYEADESAYCQMYWEQERIGDIAKRPASEQAAILLEVAHE